MSEGNHQMKVLRPDDPGLSEKRLDTCTTCHKDNNRVGRVQQIQEWQSTYDGKMKALLADGTNRELSDRAWRILHLKQGDQFFPVTEAEDAAVHKLHPWLK